jgi:hypothetical protein
MIQSPPGFIVRTEAQQAGWDHGFRLERGINGGWIGYASTTARGEVWIGAAGDKGPWFLALTHPGVIAEFGPPTAPAAIGRQAWVFATTLELHRAIDRAYRLGLSLPDAPLQTFATQTKGLPKTTEAERLVVQRIGQDIFRGALMQYWNGRCPLTGIEDPALLRASHIVAWADCDDDAHRLDVHNGLLLSALWDAAFDRGLVSFADDGAVLVSDRLSRLAQQALSVATASPILGLTDKHRANLARHREVFGPFDTTG